jgi:hypothetical protein
VQVLLQVRVIIPQLPQAAASLAPAEHSPCPEQAPKAPH